MTDYKELVKNALTSAITYAYHCDERAIDYNDCGLEKLSKIYELFVELKTEDDDMTANFVTDPASGNVQVCLTTYYFSVCKSDNVKFYENMCAADQISFSNQDGEHVVVTFYVADVFSIFG